MLSADNGRGDGIAAISIVDLELDVNRRGSGFQTSNALRVHLDRAHIHHYVEFGIQALKGHEVHVANSWFGEWRWGEGAGRQNENVTGTAIEVDGQDHWLSDIIIYSSKKGVVLTGGALEMTNTHIYNGGDGPALEVRSNAVRISGSYFDNNPVVIVDPIAVDLSHSMFLGGVGIELRSSKPNAPITGLSIMANQFVIGAGEKGMGPNRSDFVPIWLNESAGNFLKPQSTIISNNAFSRASYGDFLNQTYKFRATEVHKVLEQKAATEWVFDFSEELVFENAIDQVSVSIEAAEGFPVAVIRNITGRKVFVETSEPVTGRVHLSVKQ